MRTKKSQMNQESRTAGKARRVRSGVLGKLLIMLAIVAAVVFGVAIFFKVNTIEVQGNTVYSAEQIVEASQIRQGDNLLTVNKALAVGNIKAALPYVEDVSIARSLLRRSEVLLVDEATAALDAATAYQVTDSILSLEGMTRILVTHSLDAALLRRCDRILALRGGRIVESGTFDELMSRRDYFYSLYTVSQ